MALKMMEVGSFDSSWQNTRYGYLELGEHSRDEPFFFTYLLQILELITGLSLPYKTGVLSLDELIV